MIRSVLRAWSVAHSALAVGVALVVTAMIGLIISSIDLPALNGDGLPFPAFFLIPGVLALVATAGLRSRQHALGRVPRPWRLRCAMGAWTITLTAASVLAGAPLAATVPHGDVGLGVVIAVMSTVAVAGIAAKVSWVVGAVWIGAMPFVGNRVPVFEPVHYVMDQVPTWSVWVLLGAVVVGWVRYVWTAPDRFACGADA